MTDVILHHYPRSFFAEKIRRILAYKRVPWRSVEQPIMMPKPDLTALTGGYRRIPVMQIGADVYCDTACIARRLEQLRPEPSCFPHEHAGVATLVEDWADHRFAGQIMPSVVLELLPHLPPDILVDRAAMSPLMNRDVLAQIAPHTMRQAHVSLDRLNMQLRDRPFLLGERFSIADASCFHPIWFLKGSAGLFATVGERAALAAWFARIEGFGPGDVRPMTSTDALHVARVSEPMDVSGGERTTAGGLAPGDAVAIVADDYGREATLGTVARVTDEEITIRRTDPTLGDIAVHFPRAGYRIERP
jgi:glutathione S-transferase